MTNEQAAEILEEVKIIDDGLGSIFLDSMKLLI